MSNFRIAALFNGVDPENGPYFDEERRRVDDLGERERLLTFLRDGGTPVVRAAGLAPDPLDPSQGRVVPIVTVTDGTWIWEAAQAYYLEHYGYGPDPEFYEHIKSSNYQVQEPDDATLAEASTYLERQRTGSSDEHSSTT